jgi:hypothetical protein
VKFKPGHIVATRAALDALTAAGEDVLDYLERHLAGDWGDLSAEDKQENELSLQNGWRILSSYMLSDGTKIWVITEADRASTCILLPSDY